MTWVDSRVWSCECIAPADNHHWSQVGDDDHEVAMDFMLRGLEHHRFADTNPRHVDEAYARCASGSRLKHCPRLLKIFTAAPESMFKPF